MTTLRIHCLQHVPCETPAVIAGRAQQHRDRLDRTPLHDNFFTPRSGQLAAP